MGKGDKKTKRGKIVIGSYGVRRMRKTSSPAPEKVVKVAEIVEIAEEVKPAEEKKTKAPKKVATEKKATTTKKKKEETAPTTE